jgi:exopolysaccharide production protein ExoQ
MPPAAATLICAAFVLLLFRRDIKAHRSVSSAIWIPILWTFIIASRPVSDWLEGGTIVNVSEGPQDDTLLDKGLYFSLIISGLIVISKRPASWSTIFQFNKWLFIYFLYLALSVLWSEEPFVSFKRWVKDFGNVIMILVVLSERDPVEAAKALFIRFAYLFIPLSVLVIKYFPAASRRYDLYTNQPAFVGVSLDKNVFGMGLFVCAIGLSWVVVEALKNRPSSRATLVTFAGLLLVIVWLFRQSHSATGIACSVVGIGLLLGVNIPAMKRVVNNLGAYVCVIGVLIIGLQSSGLWDAALKQFANLMGRDPTLHGRSDIWRAALSEDINPLIGVGFYSFWTPKRNQRLSEKYYYQLGTAHNGYLETYLNSGLIGLGLLILMVAASMRRIKKEVLQGSSFGAVKFAFVAAIMFYNIAESTFDRLSPIWLVLLLVVANYPLRRAVQALEREDPQLRQKKATMTNAGWPQMSFG